MKKFACYGIALVCAVFAASAFAGDKKCALDKTMFTSPSGHVFMAQNVALDWQLYCPADDQLHSYDPKNPDATKDCQGPYGNTVIEGMLDGEKTTVTHQVVDGVPCCQWRSYKGEATATDDWKIVKEWLAAGDAPIINLGTEVLGQKSTPMSNDPGPMGKEIFTATSCRE